MCCVNKYKYKSKIKYLSYYSDRLLFCLSVAKKREPEDEQLCITVHNIKHSIITPRQTNI